MKKNIHPKYYKNTKVTCACGNTFEIGSTEPEFQLDVCSACHPLYTGSHRFVDTAGRVDKFKARLKKAKQLQDKNNQINQIKKQVDKKEK